MARSTGATVEISEKEESTYGVNPGGLFMPIRIVSIDLDEELPLVEDDTLGQGRNQLDPALDQKNDVGNLVVPVDLRFIGRRFVGLLGDPVTTTQAASVSWVFPGQPTEGLTLIVNGVTFTFVDADPGSDEILIGSDLEDTLDNVIAALNGSADTDVDDATYTEDGVDTLTATHDTPGPGGNAFTAGGTAAVAGSATMLGGAYVHTWKGGADVLPGFSLQLRHKKITDKPYELHRGIFHNTYSVSIDRSQSGGLPQATFGLIAKAMDGPSASDLTGGLDTPPAFTRFSKKHGFIEADSSVLGNVQSVGIEFTNNGEAISTVRPDDEIDGVDAGVTNIRVRLSTRFASNDLFDKAIAGTPIDIVTGFIRNAGELLQHEIHRAFLSRPKKQINGPAGVLADFDLLGANDSGESTSFTVILKNDVASY